MKPFKKKETTEDTAYMYGYRDGVYKIKELIDIWFYEEDQDALYVIAKIEGFIRGYSDTVNYHVDGIS